MIKIITMWYILPLIFSLLIVYKHYKIEQGKIKHFIQGAVFCIIPIFNVFVFVAILYLLIHYFVKNNEKVQNFLNKKL